jgi:hypothetical protein
MTCTHHDPSVAGDDAEELPIPIGRVISGTQVRPVRPGIGSHITQTLNIRMIGDEENEWSGVILG